MDNIINAPIMQKGLFIMLAGIVGVFTVLLIFYLLIKAISILFPYKEPTVTDDEEDI